MPEPKLIFKTHLSKVFLDSASSFLIYDRDLLKYSPAFRFWQRQFKLQYAVQSGEKLKDLKYFNQHIEQILKRSAEVDTRRMKFVVVGGGSLGDFGGFVASIFKRGTGLIHIPSTWLAAIDSSHGGKTALNVSSFKNQIGSFFSAEKTFIVKQLLLPQPLSRATEACGELIKIALIDNGPWVKKLLKAQSPEINISRCLRSAIQAKYKIVRKDPFEQSGHRQILNLGHTWGHVLESSFGIAHGTAVSFGLYFALEWSLHKKILNPKEFLIAHSLLEMIDLPKIKKFSRKKALQTLLQDKKTSGPQHLNFIFLKGLGRPIRLKVKTQDVLQEAVRQGWIH